MTDAIRIATAPSRPSARDFAVAFLIIGATSFGGGAVIGLIQNSLVRRRRWLTDDEFVEALVLGQSLPGPIAANTVVYIGHRLRGVRGAASALFLYVLPSFLLMTLFAALYERMRDVPAAGRLLFGLGPAVAGLIAATTWQLGEKTLSGVRRRIHFAAVFFAVLWSPRLALPLILASAFGGASLAHWREMRSGDSRRPSFRNVVTLTLLLCGISFAVWIIGAGIGGDDPNAPSVGGDDWLMRHRLPALAWIAFKSGAITFGGGYVMVPLLEHDILTQGFLSRREFADGVAMGALTPGPFVIVAAFIGYRVAGPAGALVMTLGVFAAPFCFTVWAAHSIQRFRRNALLQGALAGVCPTGVALLASAATALARGFPSSPTSALCVAVALMAGSFISMLKYALNPLYILLGCTVVGYFFAP
jgi:chromate transporter